jgi:hypothetical protein
MRTREADIATVFGLYGRLDALLGVKREARIAGKKK